MVGTGIDDLLTKGAWKTSRAKDTKGSRTSSFSDRERDRRPVHRITATIRRRDSRRNAPPPPSVEDEAESLAKEYQGSAVGSSEPDEEPKYIGDIEQNPVLLEIPENNPERRFVLVSEPSDSKPESVRPEHVRVVNSDVPVPQKPQLDGRVKHPVTPPAPSSGGSSSSGYEANTCRKYVFVPQEDDDKNRPVSPTRRELKSRRSRRSLHQAEADKVEPKKADTDSDSDCRKFVLVRDGKEDERKLESPTRQKLKQRKSQKDLSRADTKTDPQKASPLPPDCKKYVLVRNGDEDNRKPESPARHELKERKSRMNLPKVEAKNRSPERMNPLGRGHPRSRPGTQTQIDQDYISTRDVPPQDNELFEPAVVRKHSTKGRREREYYETPPSPTASRRRSGSFVDPRSVPVKSREPSRTRRETMSTGPIPKRSISNAQRSDRRRDSSHYREAEVDHHRNRTATVPSYSSSHRLERTSSTRRRTESPPSDAIESSSDVEYIPAPRSHRRSDSRRSFVAKEGRDFVLVNPNTPLDGRPRSHQTSPLASPRSSSDFPEIAKYGPHASIPPSSDAGSSWNGRDGSPTTSPRDSLPSFSHPDAERQRVRAKSKSRASFNNIANMSAPVVMNAVDQPRSPPRSDLGNPFQQSTLTVSRWQHPHFEGHGKDALTYKMFTKGVENGTSEGLPPCPYMTPTTGYRGWLTLMKCDSFTICATCFDSVFEDTMFRNEFMPLPIRSDSVSTSCSFSTSHWYQIAWFLTLKFKQPDLRILMSLSDVLTKNLPCPGMRLVPEVWYSIRDPYSTKMVPCFSACQTCISVIGVLLPPLKNAFEPRDGRRIALDGFCSMRMARNYQDTKFLEYWDALEKVADVSMATRTPPDLQKLSDDVQALSTVNHCPKDTQIRDGCWFFMRSLNELTVCKDCYMQVVNPWVKERNRIAMEFYVKSNYVGLATCQLYSERMRKVFDKSCKNGDLRYLMEKVLERRGVERELRTEMVRLAGEAGKSAYAAQKLEELAHEWTEWE